MGTSPKDERMEGWLYLIRSNRFGLQYSTKRYFVLENNSLNCFKSVPVSKREEPIRSAVIDSCIRVTDNGRESIHMNVFFIFTLYNSSNHDDQLKVEPFPSDRPHAFHSNRGCKFEQHAGLRLFKETKEGGFGGKHWADHPAIMAVGVIDASSEAIFRTLMSLGSSRTEWDFCFYRGNVVEHLDGHTDIIHKLLHRDWLPWGMKRRDLLLQRYWRREDDGTYGGGYVISPVNQGKQSVVKHMLAIDWKFWKSYLFTSSAKYVTMRMLGRVAALRELFKAGLGSYQSSDFSSGELMREIGVPQHENEDIKVEVQSIGEHSEVGPSEEEKNSLIKPANSGGSFLQLSDAADEFFDVPEESENGQIEMGWSSTPEMQSQVHDVRHPRLSAAADILKRLHELAGPHIVSSAVQKRGCIDSHDIAAGERASCCFGATLPKDPSCGLACSWTTADPSTFLIRGESYLQDHQKIKAKGTLMQMVAADWLRSDKREDDLGGRPGGIVQKYAAQGSNEFFFIINIQVPGSTTYNLALYYMMNEPIENNSLLDKFIKGDDAYRNSRFKLIPYISKGSWIVKQSVGKKACLLGIDVGSSTVARGVVSLVLGYLTNLVIEMAFLIQGNTHEELPEALIGTCRLNHLDASKAVLVK
ncbi:hypothetical protein QJS04_geneDACA015332 [Acorus gramineus]|uniref:START domain-containing protein n=1 Tax=Acorus gramineus TaxID=55184 RepID=A0AAV9APU7_ACOGR|nr:hypothetical protein QJS04_geneDACA015332 [Acorus gramineus]